MLQVAAIVALLLSPLARCATAEIPTAQPGPTTQPMPATQPVAVVPASAHVLVLPFQPLADDESPAWLGRAVQQNLLTDLAHGHLSPAGADTADPAVTPQDQGRAAGARFVITGTYQTFEGLLRFRGQIIDVNQGGAIAGGFTETGAPRDLFAIEDSLSTQAIHQLHRLMTPPTPPGHQQPTAPPSEPVAAAAPANATVFRPYDGSYLQAYVNSNRTPSDDYWSQFRTSYDRQTYYPPGYGFGSGYGYWGYPYYYGPYYGGYYGYGYGTPFVVIRATPGPIHFFSTDRSLRP